MLLRPSPTWISHVWFFFSISHPHILFSLGEGEDGESRSVPSRCEDGENRKVGTSLKTKCNKSVEIGLSSVFGSHLKRKICNLWKGKIVVGTFFLPYLSFSFAPPPLMLNCYFSDFLWDDCVPCGGFVRVEVEWHTS